MANTAGTPFRNPAIAATVAWTFVKQDVSIIIHEKSLLKAQLIMTFFKCLLVFFFLGSSIFFDAIFSFLTIPISVLCAAIYFVYFLYKSGAISEIISGILKSLCIILLAFIPIIGIIILIGYVIYNLKQSISALKQLLPEIITSFLLYSSLAASIIFKQNHSNWFYLAASIYILIAVSYSYRAQSMEPGLAFFKISVLLLALPIAWMMIISIAHSIANLLRISVGSVTRGVVVSQNVAAHMRGGTMINSYNRNVTQTITSATVNITAGSGAVTSAVLKETSSKIKGSDNPPDR